jgi:hypothetical protein
MNTKKILSLALAVFFVITTCGALYGETRLNDEMQQLVDTYAVEARTLNSDFKGFSAEDGKKLFNSSRMHSKKKESRSCTKCHTKDPSSDGRTTVGKKIEPISPAVTPKRFTEPKKVKKWFRRNCKWVLERECTPEEKGNYITYMMSL